MVRRNTPMIFSPSLLGSQELFASYAPAIFSTWSAIKSFLVRLLSTMAEIIFCGTSLKFAKSCLVSFGKGIKSMCGIVGFTGAQQAAPILLDGLSKLEYRGYDSAGIAVRDGENETEVVKAKGRLKALAEKTDNGTAVKRKLWYWSYQMGDTRRTI